MSSSTSGTVSQKVVAYMTSNHDLEQQLPSAPACLRNRDPILQVIKPILANASNVLEIGSGTGEHAIYFAEHLPHLVWHPSDLRCNHDIINAWITRSQLPNVMPPIELDAAVPGWLLSPEAERKIDAIFTANTFHIIAWELCLALLKHTAEVFKKNDEGKAGDLLIYGPFNFGGQYSSESNEKFDQWLKNRDPQSAIRNFETVAEEAAAVGFSLVADHEMPANNRLLHFKFSSS